MFNRIRLKLKKVGTHMEIFVSYSHEDKEIANKIAFTLKKMGHNVWFDDWKIKAGDNIISKINQGIKQADAIIVIVSENSLNSKWVFKEFSAMAFGEISKGSSRIIPVLIDKSSVPSYLSNYRYLDLSYNFEEGIKELINTLTHDKEQFILTSKRSYVNEIKSLGKSLSEGRLTLVCGAGISVSAGIPSWEKLLTILLESMMKRISNNKNISIDFKSAGTYNAKYSNLIIGRYLKNNLGRDFQKEVRNALYSSGIVETETMNAIVNLARPQRDRKPLDSIITFNFDSLIEEHLEKHNINIKVIYSEGIKHNSDEMPIYHVHGYLPRSGKIPVDSSIVFSEDAYHSQFIEPFSWSNLIQLNKLSQNTCLFIGLSLSDPNLRRLLDVANRKNPDKHLNHYIIKKVPSNSQNDKVDDLAFLLEEQDANELGLNVIWIDSFDELPKILNQIISSNI